MMKNVLIAACVGAIVLSAGCGDEGTTSTGGSAAEAPAGSRTPTTAPAATAGEHARIPIGKATQAGMQLVATMDSPVKPGGEGAFDVVITGGKPKAVRYWVGTEDAKGSLKAKAEEETPDNWHTHVEVPDPLPPGSRFWVEVEPSAGEPFKASFDLKVQ